MSKICRLVFVKGEKIMSNNTS